MKTKLIFSIVLLSFLISPAQKRIELTTDYGSKNKDIYEALRFQGVEVINLKFSGENLKNKGYTLLLKEFNNGALSNIDTLISTKKDPYLQLIGSDTFKFNFYVKTQLDNTIKMSAIFDRFSVTKKYQIKKPKDDYALHDFLDGSKRLQIEEGKPTYILGYFLPYIDKKTGWKKYCDVAGSKHKPDEWGKVFNIPNYFLIDILFH
ncbi:hypothetical protein [Aureibaculum conchae]|uniref:hypothetical protein n=1 Tax=Aureibaculum sp. 2308TA14-22 TaxID=3108392 RepID=UPI0033933D03